MILFLAMAASVGQSHKPAKLPPIKPIDLKTVPHPIAYPPPPPPVMMVPSPPPAPPIARQTGPNLPPQPVNSPGSWIINDDYPSQALRDEVQGLVSFQLSVTKWGTLSDCTITSSSGSPLLDEATCKIIMRRARFYPATDKDAKPVASTFASRVSWVLPEDEPAPSTASVPVAPFRPPPPYIPSEAFPRPPMLYGYDWPRITNEDFPERARTEKREGTSMLSLSVGMTGAVEGCKVTQSSGHADLDQKSCEIARSRAKFGPALGVNGEAIIGRYETGVNWYLKGEEAAALPPPPPLPQKPIFDKSGEMTLRFTQGKDGTLSNCTFSVVGFDPGRASGLDVCNSPRDLGNARFRPYADDKGNPVARDVTVQMKVSIDPPKTK